jgi:hypothetical protein
MGTYASDARAAIGRCRVTARYTVERLRRESVQLAPCYGWHRQRVRADLERCQRCGMLLCDRCAGRCFCRDSLRVTEMASTLCAHG